MRRIRCAVMGNGVEKVKELVKLGWNHKYV